MVSLLYKLPVLLSIDIRSLIYKLSGRGFFFSAFDSDDFIQLIKMAIYLNCENHDDFQLSVKNAMKYDVSGSAVSELYMGLYQEIVIGKQLTTIQCNRLHFFVAFIKYSIYNVIGLYIHSTMRRKVSR